MHASKSIHPADPHVLLAPIPLMSFQLSFGRGVLMLQGIDKYHIFRPGGVGVARGKRPKGGSWWSPSSWKRLPQNTTVSSRRTRLEVKPVP